MTVSLLSIFDMVENHKMVVENSGLLSVAAQEMQNKKIARILSGAHGHNHHIPSAVQHGL